MRDLQAGGAGAVQQLLGGPEARREGDPFHPPIVQAVLEARGADAGLGIAAPDLPHLQGAAAGTLEDQTLGESRGPALLRREPRGVEEKASVRRKMADDDGERAVAVFVSGQMDEGIVYGDDQVEAGPERDLAHVGDQKRDVGRAGEPPAGDRDHLRSEIERHNPSGGAGQKRRGASGAGSQLQDATIRGLSGRPRPELPVAAVGQLLLEERQDAVVVGANLIGLGVRSSGHGGGL